MLSIVLTTVLWKHSQYLFKAFEIGNSSSWLLQYLILKYISWNVTETFSIFLNSDDLFSSKYIQWRSSEKDYFENSQYQVSVRILECVLLSRQHTSYVGSFPINIQDVWDRSNLSNWKKSTWDFKEIPIQQIQEELCHFNEGSPFKLIRILSQTFDSIQVEKDARLIVEDDRLDDCTTQDLMEELPTHQPRFVVSRWSSDVIFEAWHCRCIPSPTHMEMGESRTRWSSSSPVHQGAAWSSTWCTPAVR